MSRNHEGYDRKIDDSDKVRRDRREQVAREAGRIATERKVREDRASETLGRAAARGSAKDPRR